MGEHRDSGEYLQAESAKERRNRRLGCSLGVFGAALASPFIVLGILFVVGTLVLSSISFDGCDLRPPNRDDCRSSKLPLVQASVTDAAKVRQLIADGADPNEADDLDELGTRALPCAALVGNLESVEALLDGGADANLSGYVGGRPIVAAVSGEGRRGNAPSPTDSDVDFARLDDPVRIQIVTRLVEAGADPTVALSPAIEKGSMAMVDALVGLGADIGGSGDQPSPLMSAVYGGHLELLQVMIIHGADVDDGGAVDRGQALLLFFSAWADRPAPSGASTTVTLPPIPETGTVTPLAAAVVLRHPLNRPTNEPGGQATYSVERDQVLDALLAAGADPNLPSFELYTPLYLAVLLRDQSAAVRLVAAGAVADPPGLASATEVASANGDAEMLAILGG